MFLSSKNQVSHITMFLLGLCGLAITSVGVSAKEYRLFVNDAASCRSAGVTGDVCLVAVGASVSSTTSAPVTSVTTGSNSDCVVTTWNRCAGATTTTTTTPTTANATPTTATATPTSTPPSPSAPVPGGSVAGGNLDFGSGGGNTGSSNYVVDVTAKTIAYPFTVKPGNFFGKVSMVKTIKAWPADYSGVRMWWSTTAGGSPLAGGCAAFMGSNGSAYWDQTGTLGYGCSIPNQAATLYLNFQSCISDRSDKACSASGAKAGSTAQVYLSAKRYNQ